MNKIFIEAKHDKTSEYNFLKTILAQYFPDKDVCFIFMNGVGNLFGESIQNQIRQSQDEGDNVLVILDADFPDKGWGYAKRKKDVMENMQLNQISFPFFLYPDNQNDGDVETLMESLACKDTHKEWWGCFTDYEMCVKGIKGSEGKLMYNVPNRKAKLHTYISSQRLSNKQRDKIGQGHWLFDDKAYWDLNKDDLKPLLDFFRENLK